MYNVCCMKNKELEAFDKDDWLSKEIQRESRISAWDFDESKKIRNEHQDNCDVKENADIHHFNHVLRNKTGQKAIRQIDGIDRGESEFWFFLDVVLLIVLFLLNVMFPRYSFMAAPIILFLGINPGIFIWLLVLRRFPSKTYSKVLFVFALILQLLGSIYNVYFK